MVWKLRRFEHRGKDSAPADVTSEELIEFLEPLVTPARAQRIRQVLPRPAYQAWLLSLRPEKLVGLLVKKRQILHAVFWLLLHPSHPLQTRHEVWCRYHIIQCAGGERALIPDASGG